VGGAEMCGREMCCKGDGELVYGGHVERSLRLKPIADSPGRPLPVSVNRTHLNERASRGW
jgi:hypothetical protein